MKTALIIAGLAGATILGNLPGIVQDAAAETDVVFVGGTGTGTVLVPHNPKVPKGFTEPFGLEVGHGTSVLYAGAPLDRPQDSAELVSGIIAEQERPVTAVCLSKGAQVCRGAEQLDTRTDTRYVLIGDPDGDHGISRAFGASAPKREFTHDTEIITAEYDGVADWPDRPMNLIASANALAGWVTTHTQYGNGTKRDPLTRLDEAEVTETRNANGTKLTHKLIPTKNLPLLQGLRDTEFTWTGDDKFTRAIEKPLRQVVDAGYSRNDGRKSDESNGVDRHSDGTGSSSDSGTGGDSDSDL